MSLDNQKLCQRSYSKTCLKPILKIDKTKAGPLADSHEIKGFYKGYFRQNKGCFIEILTKIKRKFTSNYLVFLSVPDL